MNYPYTLPQLPYAYDSLEPILSLATLYFHHDKHFQSYVDKLNKALQNYPLLQPIPLESLLINLEELPKEIRKEIRHNGGGVYNHTLYFDTLTPLSMNPCGLVVEALKASFGSLESWAFNMQESAMSVFGSGYAWLLKTSDQSLIIETTQNQDVPDLQLYQPILLIDVWEHAYYLDYQNRRDDYVNNWFRLLNWNKIEELYQQL